MLIKKIAQNGNILYYEEYNNDALSYLLFICEVSSTIFNKEKLFNVSYTTQYIEEDGSVNNLISGSINYIPAEVDNLKYIIDNCFTFMWNAYSDTEIISFKETSKDLFEEKIDTFAKNMLETYFPK